MDVAVRARNLLSGHDYPAPKKDLVQRAHQLRGDAEVLEALENIPAGVYSSAGELSEHVAGKHAAD
jgi:hypothetical protein